MVDLYNNVPGPTVLGNPLGHYDAILGVYPDNSRHLCMSNIKCYW